MVYLLKKSFDYFVTRIFSRRFESGVRYKQAGHKPTGFVIDHTNEQGCISDILFFIELIQLANQSNLDVVLVLSSYFITILFWSNILTFIQMMFHQVLC